MGLAAVAFSRSGGEHVQTGPANRPTTTTTSDVDYIECQDHTTIPKRGADASRAPFDVATEKCPHVGGTIILAHCPNGILAIAGVDVAGTPSGPPDSDTIPPGPPPSMALDPCQPEASSSGPGK